METPRACRPHPDATIYQGDCLEVMPSLEAGSVDAIICDLPYGATGSAWDVVIPFEPLWTQYGRLLKPRGAVVLTATQPFTSMLVMSNPEWFRYCWVWNKKKPSGFQIAKYRPMMVHEDVVVFGRESPQYFPIRTPRSRPKDGRPYRSSESSPLAYNDGNDRTYVDFLPKSIIEISNANQKDRVHSTQKPVVLMEYLIRTYSNPGETILDNTMGSGTTGEACLRSGRRFIGIELDPGYFQIAADRLAGPPTPLFDSRPLSPIRTQPDLFASLGEAPL